MKNIDYKELQDWIKQGKNFQLIDVREPDEHAAFNIGGTLTPLSIFVKTTELDTSTPLVIYCKRGIRSQLAIQRLSSRFPDAAFYNLQNGILHLSNWKNIN
jgi:rhodanese-related sulfurtransferase